jgi:hypothetical protein
VHIKSELEFDIHKSIYDNGLHSVLFTGRSFPMHHLFALTFLNPLLMLLASTVERDSEIKLADPK